MLDCLVQSELLCCMIMALNCRVIWAVVSILKLTNMVAGKEQLRKEFNAMGIEYKH